MLPLLEILLHLDGGQAILRQQSATCGQLGPEPVQRQLAQAGLLLFGQVVGPDSLAGRGQGGLGPGVGFSKVMASVIGGFECAAEFRGPAPRFDHAVLGLVLHPARPAQREQPA